MMIQLQLPAGQCVRRCASSAPAKVTRPKVVVRSSATQTTNGVAKEIFDDETKTKLDQLMLRWKTFDTDGNGYIDREELRHLLESTDDGSAVMFTEHWLPEDELDRVMDQYDKDKNGVIDFEEFKEIVYDGLLLDGKLSEYEAAFKAVDSSGNGSIGANELAEVFRSLGNPISYDKLVEVMQHFDKDESGQIEFNEFLLMFRDQLLELKTIQSYMLSVDPDRATSSMMVDAPEGDIALIFSEQEMDDLIAQSAKSGRLMVLFCGLTWCRPCKGMLRPAQRLAENYKDTTTWVKLYGNANRQTKNIFKDRLKIRSTPCFLIYKDGEVVFNMTGSNKEKLETGLREALGGEEGATRLPRMLYSKGVGYV